MTDRASRQSAVRIPKPIGRGWLHLVWFPLSLIAGAFLIAGARSTVTAVAYAGGVSAMFGTSAAYHRVDWRPAVNRILQRLDHLMIFVLIAGTATPMYQVAAPDRYRAICLVLTWGLAILAAVLHVARMDAPERVVGGTYIALGAVAVPAFPVVWIHSGPVAGGLACAGGLLYIAGALAYHYRRPNPAPVVFGYHEVFHALVCAGATVHYAAVFLLLVN